MDLRVTGAEDLAKVARRLKEQGESGKGLRKELFAGIQRSTKPLRAKIKESARTTLPSRGGLAADIAGSRISTSTRANSKWPAVRIVGKDNRDINALNRGRLRHPVFGNRGKWRSQQVDKGWFSDPIEKEAPAIRAELQDVVRNVANKIERN